MQLLHKTCAESAHNKTNYTKINKTKRECTGVKNVGEVLRTREYPV